MNPIDLNKVASAWKFFGFDAEPIAYTSKKTGEVFEGIEIRGVPGADVKIDYSAGRAVPERQIYTTAGKGYRPVVYENGEAVRFRNPETGKWDFKRGEPLSDAELKNHKAKTFAKACALVTAPMILAHYHALHGGDLAALAKGFGVRGVGTTQPDTGSTTDQDGDPTAGAYGDDEPEDRPGPVATAATARKPAQTGGRPSTF